MPQCAYRVLTMAARRAERWVVAVPQEELVVTGLPAL